MAEKIVQADLELKKAFTELQAKMILTKRKIKIADGQIEALKREKAYAEITDKEISNLQPTTRTYESIGRLFILTDAKTVRQHLKEKCTAAEENTVNLENSKKILENSVKESENNLRELVQQWKSKPEA